MLKPVFTLHTHGKQNSGLRYTMRFLSFWTVQPQIPYHHFHHNLYKNRNYSPLLVLYDNGCERVTARGMAVFFAVRGRDSWCLGFNVHLFHIWKFWTSKYARHTLPVCINTGSPGSNRADAWVIFNFKSLVGAWLCTQKSARGETKLFLWQHRHHVVAFSRKKKDSRVVDRETRWVVYMVWLLIWLCGRLVKKIRSRSKKEKESATTTVLWLIKH